MNKNSRNINWINLTSFYFNKMVLSIWFYIFLIFVPLMISISFYTILPAFLTINDIFAFTIVLNVLIFYGILFFNFRRSHFYPLVKQKFKSKLFIYIPLFLNLIIVSIITFLITLFITFIFMQLDWMAIANWTNADHYYEIKDISDYRWGILIYYIAIIFFITFMLAFLIQAISRSFNSYILISIFLFVFFFFFSGVLEITIFLNPVSSNNPDDLLYSYDPVNRVITFKPYFDYNDPYFIEKEFFRTFTFRNFLEMINPYYWITKWGQFDIFIDNYRITTIMLPGIGLPNDQLIINASDPNTWVLLKYQMFSFKSLLWSCYLFLPYFFILFYGFLGIIILKVKKIYHN
ncbi:hypothetical protein [Candidatus Hepatoplasma crinochetorum]|uniref:hypothetical protein n=1 Tax=Candidatus Hepatoplasma crinochetorum TaxID=295596 RepID=UPI0030909C96|nr:MAG: hypothetical protein HCTKY_3000 [Candidatus Hepatoplasma crinochetorum]